MNFPDLDLSGAEAYALAELCKRIGWSDVRSLSFDEDEARRMLSAMDKVRFALAAKGYTVR